MKAAILRRFDINEETYRQRFRAAVKKEGESHRELAIRLQDAAEKWTKDCSSVQQIREIMVIEQLLDTLPEEICVWVGNPKPVWQLENWQTVISRPARSTQNKRRLALARSKRSGKFQLLGSGVAHARTVDTGRVTVRRKASPS